MGKGLQTRDAIVGEGLRQASRVGLEGLSLAPLAESLSLSKSGLFAHFKSKEALQLEILDEAVERFKEQVVIPSARERDPEAKLRSIFERYLAWIRGSDEDGGCLFMTMIQEYDDRPGEIRERLVEAQRNWRGLLADLAQQASGGRASRDRSAQTVFEIVGAALAYQHAVKLLGDRSARRKAMTAFEAILSNLRN